MHVPGQHSPPPPCELANAKDIHHPYKLFYMHTWYCFLDIRRIRWNDPLERDHRTRCNCKERDGENKNHTSPPEAFKSDSSTIDSALNVTLYSE